MLEKRREYSYKEAAHQLLIEFKKACDSVRREVDSQFRAVKSVYSLSKPISIVLLRN